MPDHKNQNVWNSMEHGFLSQRKQSILNGTCPDATDREINHLYGELTQRNLPEYLKVLDDLYPEAAFKESKALVRNAGYDPKEHTYS